MKKGFTLIELLAVIVILTMTITLVVVKVDKNIKEANKFKNERAANTLENAAVLFIDDYSNELSNFDTLNVDVITIAQLIDKGLIDSKEIKDPTSNVVVVANINGITKAKYTKTTKNTIFINGPSQISIIINAQYNELGAYVAIPNTGVVQLTGSNITSNVETGTLGDYEITYTYSGADTIKRIVSVIDY